MREKERGRRRERGGGGGERENELNEERISQTVFTEKKKKS